MRLACPRPSRSSAPKKLPGLDRSIIPRDVYQLDTAAKPRSIQDAPHVLYVVSTLDVDCHWSVVVGSHLFSFEQGPSHCPITRARAEVDEFSVIMSSWSLQHVVYTHLLAPAQFEVVTCHLSAPSSSTPLDIPDLRRSVYPTCPSSHST